MAVKTYLEQLESVQDAIARIESGGQAVDINGRALTEAELETLYRRESRLRTMVVRESRGGIRTMRVTPK